MSSETSVTSNTAHIYTDDGLFKVDPVLNKELLKSKSWEKDSTWFKDCKVSALALLKMMAHCGTGGNNEVMGLMVGRIEDPNTMIVVDSFPLPVEGTETRVNAHAEAYEYMSVYMNRLEKVGRFENVIGWYHSHPGYGCWLSGIDVSTQMLSQKYQDPWLAIVIDPFRTVSTGTIDIGAFRTYQKDEYAPAIQNRNIPLNKLMEFGVHCRKYYKLNISYFVSSIDTKIFSYLQNKQWINTLSSQPKIEDYCTSEVKDISEKIDSVTSSIASSAFTSSENSNLDSEIKNLTSAGRNTASEITQMCISLVMNNSNFLPMLNSVDKTIHLMNQSDIEKQRFLINTDDQTVNDSKMFNLWILILLCSQVLLIYWKRNAFKSYQVITLLIMWIVPFGLSVSHGYFVFKIVWILYTSGSLNIIRLINQNPIKKTTPRSVYKWFLIMHIVTYSLAVVGYITFVLCLFSINPFLFISLDKSFLISIILFFYGIYFGILGRDLATIYTDKMTVKLGYYSTESSLTSKILSDDICALCNNPIFVFGHNTVVIESTLRLSCGHTFHEFCIRGWSIIGKKSTCPYCHEKFDAKIVVKKLWDKQNLFYGNLLDVFRYLVSWNPILLLLTNGIFKYLHWK
ncbi:hypothetical protein GJ496_004843 [Pomphorhynchus laevis]|nr:hypothetical protein GJ496_004843 [Pomphorhynchus laevis]